MRIGDHDTHELADCYPLMVGAAFAGLVDDIKTNGLRDGFEIVLLERRGHGCEDYILDGRNRYRACLAAKVEPRFKVYAGAEDVESLAQYIVSVNHARRNLDDGQGALAVRRMTKVIRETAKRNAKQSNLPGVSDDHAGMADAVIADGIRELRDAVDRGDVPLSVAAAASKLEPDKQRAVVDAVEARVAAEAAPVKRDKAVDQAVMSVAIRLTPVDVVALRALVYVGDKSPHAEVRAGGDVVRRLVEGVARREK